MAVPVIQFPSICPKGRRVFRPGYFGSKSFQFRSGASGIRNIGSLESDAEFEVDFGLIKDADATEILKAYLDASGSSYRVLIASILFIGVSSDFLDVIPEHFHWHFAEEPSITSEMPGWSRTQVKFVGIAPFKP